jgi:hypothetical protein
MTQITGRADCGNSPKNLLLQELTIAIACADMQSIANLVSDDVSWLPAGGEAVAGTAAVREAITREGPAASVTIDHVISHGKAGAVDGVIVYGRTSRAFCHVFEFTTARGTAVRRITSYADRDKPSTIDI